MTTSSYSDPAERHRFLRYFYRGWHPTRAGHWANRLTGWLVDRGLSPDLMAMLEVRGRASGKPRSTPVVIVSLAGQRYLVSMLGPGSGWVRNVEAAGGAAGLRLRGQGHPIQLVAVAVADRGPILREYVRVATSGRHHFPVAVDAPLSEFQAIADRYPVYRIDPA